MKKEIAFETKLIKEQKKEKGEAPHSRRAEPTCDHPGVLESGDPLLHL